MSWVVRFKEDLEVQIARRIFIPLLTFATSATALVSLARAATMNFIDEGPGRIVPMYGVPVTIGPPIVKYGPAPVPTATISPIAPAFSMPAFDWGSIFPSFGGKPSPGFSAPDFSHLMPSFPKLFGLATSDLLATLALIAYVSLLLAAVCGWAFHGSKWYLKSKRKK
jgi:hypothetical protein